MKVTKVSKATKRWSIEHPNKRVWYFRKGNNEGFIIQEMKPTLSQMGFNSYEDLTCRGYLNGRIW